MAFSSTFLTMIELILFSSSFRFKFKATPFRLFGGLIFILTQFTDLVVKQGIPATSFTSEGTIYGEGFAAWSVLILLMGGFLIATLVSVLISAKGVKKAQVSLIFSLFVLSIALVIIFNLILPNFGINSFIFVGQYATFIFALGSAWVIVQEKVYSLKYILSNILAILTAAIILFLLSWGTQKFEQLILGWDITKVNDLRIFIFGFVVACTVAIFIEKLLPQIRGFFFKALKVSYESLYKINEWLIDQSNNNIEIQNYVQDLIHYFNNALSSKDVIIFIPSEKRYYSENKINKKIIKEISSLTYIKSPFSFDDNHQRDFALYFPLNNDKELLAVVIFLHKKNNGFYSKEEISQLFRIMKILKMAINRFLLYEEQKRFNQTLEISIEKATKELDRKNKLLARNLQYERDILDILGHELRTPLTIARNAISLNKTLLGNPQKNHPKIVQYNDVASENIDREIMTLETLLAVTKIDNKRMEINLEKVDLFDVVNDSFAGLEHKAKEKGLQLISKISKTIYIKADRAKIQEVSDNLIDNAIKYTQKGSVTISLEKGDDEIKMSITDTGVGIPEDEIKHLGKKFYRVNNYIRSGKKTDLNIVRPGGTGLGLYVTFTLIKLMDGNYEIKSNVGKGTTFILTFKKWAESK
jgi:signal transduction histidine kinase